MHNDLHVPGIWLKNFLTWKKRLLIRTVFVLIDLKTDRSTWSSIAQKARVSFLAYICMCQRCLLQNRRVWDGVKHRNEKEHSSSWNPLGEKTNNIIILLYIHHLISFEFISIVGSQLHCALGFTAHRCDYIWIFRRTTKNPVAYATS